jgi:hypothetical protein
VSPRLISFLTLIRWRSNPRHWYNRVSCDKALSIRSVIEIPGLYQQHRNMFLEPKPEGHAKLLRVLPRLKPRFGHGDAVSYQIEFLGNDGQRYSFHLSEENKTDEKFYQQNLNDSLYGAVEWIFQHHDHAKRCDLTVVHFPRILSTSNLKLKAASGSLKSLEEISNPALISSSLLIARHRFEEFKSSSVMNERSQSSFEQAKIQLVSAEEQRQQHTSIGIQSHFREHLLHTASSSEQLYYLRRSFASQGGVTSLLCYFLNLRPASPRDLILSVQNGTIPIPQLASQQLQMQKLPFRLSPAMVQAISSIEAYKASMGHAAIAIESKRDLTQVCPSIFDKYPDDLPPGALTPLGTEQFVSTRRLRHQWLTIQRWGIVFRSNFFSVTHS